MKCVFEIKLFYVKNKHPENKTLFRVLILKSFFLIFILSNLFPYMDGEPQEL